ncbi:MULTISPECIES: heme biosynthesis protein HemY [Actibacterium]|uniref:HemY protein n=1 Tax=Actibacterium naphthalenivorans TaxID=1614693 RepID=A0A840C9W4_9RHOB|nr:MULTISPECIES: heme biosynthesis HemY N-terminal domain-containing protein [Actibacterium]ALG88839.1 heme biosynthesis protein HemY [Actibacterium sp. EMB200-NS6]MBB4021653.1 HemY protein [Actibacterium naphthalenivorans]
MLWSLLKILLFVVLVAGLTLGAGFLMEIDTGLRIAFAGWEFTLGPLQAVIVALLLLVLIWAVLKLAGFLVALLRFVMGDETALSRYFNRNRERRGFKALADSMMALASGDGREAMTKAARAERLLHRPELTNLLTAQAAELAGDRKKAQEVYKQLLSDDRTRFVGIRGIMKQKLAEGDTDTALKLAEKAFALKPGHVETQDTLLRLQAEHADWVGARKTLNAKLKHGALPRDVHKRRDAVLALSGARDVLAEGKTIEAREAAVEANRLSPDLIPAAAMAARTYIEQGKPRYAARVLKKAWEAQPHPELATAFAEIKPDESPAERVKRFRALTSLAPDHPETRMLLAELHIAAEDFPEARKALGNLAETDPTARALTLMAAIERGQGADDSVVRGWLTRALTASRGPQWICDNCGTVHAAWAPICGQCGSFDTLSWKIAPTGELTMPHSTEMLPLIVGAIEDTPEDIEPAESVEEGGAEESVSEAEVLAPEEQEKAVN